MAKGAAARNLMVGVVFLGSLVILGVVSLKLKVLPFLNQVEAFEVRFPNVDQLLEGDAVVVHGLNVGNVDDIRYEPAQPSTPIVVKCSVPGEVKAQLDGRTQFTVRSSGPLGGRYLDIRPGPPGEPAVPPPLSGFVGEAPGDLFDQLAALVQKNGKLSDTLENLANASTEIRNTFRAINEGKGMLGLAVQDQEMKERFSKGLTDLFDVIANLKDEKGAIPYLLNNEQAKEDLRSAVTDLRQMLRDIREGDGLASRLLNDKEMPKKFNEILDDFHEIVHKVNTGQGTLGQVVNNPKAWDELVKIFVLARETIEDMREQAPISTFVNAAFSAF